MAGSEAQPAAIIAITRNGVLQASRLREGLAGSRLYVPARIARYVPDGQAQVFEGPVSAVLAEVFRRHRQIVLFVALGAAVRLLAPLVRDKRTDPAVVVVDEAGRYAISALSGHLGGANDLARRTASILGAEPVITTATDVLGTISPDLIGREYGWAIENEGVLTQASAALINGEVVGLFQDAGERDWWPAGHQWPGNLQVFDNLESLADSPCAAALVMTDRLLGKEYGPLLGKSVVYRPKSLVAGVGCDRGVAEEEIEQAVLSVLQEHSLAIRSLRNLATIDIKSSEEGLLGFAQTYRLPLAYFSAEQLNAVEAVANPSDTVLRIVGTKGVCEPAALLSAGTEKLLVPKQKVGRVTVAVARIDPEPSSGATKAASSSDAGTGAFLEAEAGRAGRDLLAPFPEQSPTTNGVSVPGPVFVVGLGPGAREQMTFRAREALAACDAVVGYETYLDLISDLLTGKEIVSSGMRHEVARARAAMGLAEAGKKVAVVSGGDAGVYGMAGLIYEVARARGWTSTENIEVVPGVSALNAAAALLGAPLMHDFAVISLSDLLTPWETIVRRLEAAGGGDFVVALYNPKSGRRTHQVEEARRILLAHRSGATPVGLVTSAYRQGQVVVITDLEHMLEFEMGMLTTIIVGNSRSTSFGHAMVTPRGYADKYALGDALAEDVWP